VSDARVHIDLAKRLGSFQLQINLELGTEVLVLFGPSGGGKTSTLNLVAGLSTPDEGEIVMDGNVWFRRKRSGPPAHVPARQRRVGYVFQDYALFPHLTALQNVAFGLARAPDASARARTLLERVSMTSFAERRPHELSGGQQQRVAIARALAVQPKVLLLDEPFTALEAGVRERLQQELRALQRELRLVVVYVTHRIEDAFAMGDRIAVLRAGHIEQVGPIDDVFRRPVNKQVAEVLGIRNLFHACVQHTDEGPALGWDGIPLHAAGSLTTGTEVTAYIRPEDIKIVYPDRPLSRAVSENVLDAEITASYRNAAFRVLRVRVPNGHELEVRFPAYSYAPLPLEPGDPVRIALRREGIIVLEPNLVKLI
jgi:molybdate transport system ATP-binding protein